MIDGIQIRCTSDQLREHYTAKLDECRKLFDAWVARELELADNPNNEQFKSIRLLEAQMKISCFEQRGQLFEKLLAHLIEGETYSFTYKEAAELELLPANVALIREEKPST